MNDEELKNNKEEKRKETLKDKGGDLFAIGAALASLIGIFYSCETSSQEFLSESTQPFSLTKGLGMSAKEGGMSTTENGPTETCGMTTTIGLISSTIEGEPPVLHIGDIEIFEDSSGNIHINDENDYARVEHRAQGIYDTFNKGHEVSESANGVIVPSKELAMSLERILNSGSKESMYQTLTALQEVIEEQDSKEKSISLELKEGKKNNNE